MQHLKQCINPKVIVGLEALRARVFELEARLSAESRRDETRPAEPAAVDPAPAAAGSENSR